MIKKINTERDIVKYIDKIKTTLGLSEWRIFVVVTKNEPDSHLCPQDAVASTDVFYNYKNSQIIFYENFFRLDEEMKKHTIIHELMHLHTGFWEIYETALLKDSKKKNKMHGFNFEILKYVEEETTEKLARAFYNIIEK